jgi:hypothetical protein
MLYEFVVTLSWTASGTRQQTVLGDYTSRPYELSREIRRGILIKATKELGLDIERQNITVLFMDFRPNT